MSDIEELLNADGEEWRHGVAIGRLKIPPAGEPGTHRVAFAPVAAYEDSEVGNNRRRPWLILAACVITAAICGIGFLVASGTGGNSHNAGNGSAPTQQPVVPAGKIDSKIPVTISVPPATLPANLLSATEARKGISMEWALTGIDDTTKTITVYYQQGDTDCIKPMGFYVEQTAREVLVEAVSHVASNPNGCADVSATGISRIPLRAPLGSRELIHAAVTNPLARIPLLQGQLGTPSDAAS